MTLAFIFPGQGTQAVGMGKEIAKIYPEAKLTFEEVDDALKQNLSKLMFEGPEEELVLTENAQPALMAVSIALIRSLQAAGNFDISDKCKFVAGHSLGEYSALTAAHSFDVQDAARVLKERGRAMQDAVPLGQGAMAALIGVDLWQAEQIAAEAAKDEVCVAANDNAPGQIVLSGSIEAVQRAVRIGKEQGVKRCMLLPVSAPFHCPLMAPAAETMEKVLGKIKPRRPAVPLISNVNAEPEADAEKILQLLVQQITSRVQWRQSIENMKELGVNDFVEVGVGRVLTGMVRRVNKDLNGIAIQSADDIEEFLNSI